MLKIYGIHTLNTFKVVLTVEYLELDYEFIRLDFSKGEHKTPEHLARHPLGQVPVIEHDGKYLSESNAICVYLADAHQSPLYTGGSYEKALIHQWIDMVSFQIGRWLFVWYLEYYIKPELLNLPSEESNVREADSYLDRQLPVLEAQFQQHEYLCGSALTVADLITFSYFHTHEVSGFSFTGYSALSRWYRQIRELPAFTRAAGKLGLNK